MCFWWGTESLLYMDNRTQTIELSGERHRTTEWRVTAWMELCPLNGIEMSHPFEVSKCWPCDYLPLRDAQEASMVSWLVELRLFCCLWILKAYTFFHQPDWTPCNRHKILGTNVNIWALSLSVHNFSKATQEYISTLYVGWKHSL